MMIEKALAHSFELNSIKCSLKRNVFYSKESIAQMKGQSLTEMLVTLPLFLMLVCGCIAFLEASNWQASFLQSARMIELYLSNTHNSHRAVERIQRVSAPRTQTQSQQHPAQSRLKLSVRPLHTGAALHADADFKNRLLPFSPLLQEILHKSKGQDEDLRTVFDASDHFPLEKRREWRTHLKRGLRSPRQIFALQAFSMRVARGGKESQIPSFNLTRDCLYSAQGHFCMGENKRTPGVVFQAFQNHRRISAAAQASLCAAEACAKTPHPIACAAATLASGLYLVTESQGPPTICPVTVQSAKIIHSSGKKSLSLLEQQQRLANLCSKRSSTRSAASPSSQLSTHCRQALGLNSQKVFAEWPGLVDSLQSMY